MMRTTLTATLVLAAFVSFPVSATEKKSEAPRPTPAAEAAMKIHVDPATGQVIAPKSSPDAARPTTAAASAEAFPPTRVEKVTTKAGGKKVALHGRFMMEMTAKVGPDGKVTHDCVAVEETGAKATSAKEPRHDR